MAPQEQPPGMDPEVIAGKLQEIAAMLRETDHLGLEAKQAFAALADEMVVVLGLTVPAGETAHFVQCAARLADALRHQRDNGPLAAARDHLQESAAQFEARAPEVAAFSRRLLDVLANLGI